jgi:PAS domain S-box-containing protein
LIENVQDGVFLIQDGELKFVNEAFARIPGYTVEEVLRMGFWELVAPEDRDMFADRYARMMAGEGVPVGYEFHVVRKNDDTRTAVHVTVGLIEYQGKPTVIGTVKDITGQKLAEDALWKSESEYQDLFDNMMDGLMVHRLIVDEDGEPVDYVLEKINNSAERILSWNRADMEGKRATEIYDGDAPFIERYARVAQTGKSAHFIDYYPRFKQWCEIESFCPMPGYFANVFRDITERKETEDALRKSEEKYRALFETAKDAIFLSDDVGKFVDVNQAACESLGYSREELLRLSNREIEADPTGYDAFLKVRDTSTKEAIFEVNQQRKDGTLLPVEITGKFFNVDGELLFLEIARDITERKRAEDALRESEEKLRSIVEQSGDGIVLVDEEGTIIEWNLGQERITGLSRAEVLGRPLWDVQFRMAANDPDNPVVYEQVKAGVLKILETGQLGWLGRLEEAVIKRPGGTRRVIQAAVFPIKTDKGFMAGAISRDITEREAAEEQIKRSLREKDVLMHEIHHRVKNNLQVASSLLSMQARTTSNKEAIDALSKSQSRINTMALIHTQLYESGDLSELNMNEFVGTLSGKLLQGYPVSDTTITPIIHVTDHKFPISVGLHVGLIINELLSNAIEHAFGERKDGKIEIGLTASDHGRVNLRISDDGVGLPHGFDIDTTKTLGLHLVKILVEDQLQGKLEVISDGGATFNMEFDIG